jgi:SAM-dependent methyltransferase
MRSLDFRKSYNRLVQSLTTEHETDHAMRLAIGAEFDAFGVIERELLIHYGLPQDGFLIDVGCGSGRLAKPLSAYLTGPYLGIDVVPDLVDYARTFVDRADWRFEVTDGLHIAVDNDVADMVCFFSVFTHLLHEQSYAYLREAKRVLKPGGKIVFSFLDFAIPCHWDIFEGNLAATTGDYPLNMFMSRDGIRVWADHLQLEVAAMHNGDAPHIPLSHAVTLSDGRVMEEYGHLGQSVCVLVKP